MSAILEKSFDPSTIWRNANLATEIAEALPIFPCYEMDDDLDLNVKAKRPLYCVQWDSARPGQHERVKRWWADHPDAMPAINLGAVGLIVFDADGPEGIAAFEALCEPHGGVPECPMVDTPSGGRHYYFRQRPGEKLGNGRGALPPKGECSIDVRGAGGYTIAPGSMRGDAYWSEASETAWGIYSMPDGHPLDILQAPEIPDFLRDIL